MANCVDLPFFSLKVYRLPTTPCAAKHAWCVKTLRVKVGARLFVCLFAQKGYICINLWHKNELAKLSVGLIMLSGQFVI